MRPPRARVVRDEHGKHVPLTSVGEGGHVNKQAPHLDRLFFRGKPGGGAQLALWGLARSVQRPLLMSSSVKEGRRAGGGVRPGWHAAADALVGQHQDVGGLCSYIYQC